MPIRRSLHLVALLLILLAGCGQRETTVLPTAVPAPAATAAPAATIAPTVAPTTAPTLAPTIAPTVAKPTAAPTVAKPTAAPTANAGEIVPNALPFTLGFEQLSLPAGTVLPTLQSYAIATTSANQWLIVGGRTQGLHTFQETADNFPPTSANNVMWVIDPSSGAYTQFDVNKLPPTKSAPLQATNQESYYDRATDQLYIVGGYGWKADQSDMITFGTILRFPVAKMVAALTANPQVVADIDKLIEVGSDDRLAVTGGELTRLGSTFYLSFGQKFMGQYRAFSGGGPAPFTQEYTEEVRTFTLFPGTLEINAYGASSSSDPDQPYHRRDGNVVEDIDPATSKPRIAGYGGVFKPGQIAAYQEPVYITGNGIVQVDRSTEQLFSQYECPVIPVYDDTGKAMYNTFFGGISHSYYSQTAAQHTVYEQVTQQGRNDGFPFIADISTLVQNSDGSYAEYILPSPIPGNLLLGSSIPFILSPALAGSAMVYENGTIKLSGIAQGQKVLIGYIYGGIEADNPLPIQPNSGTHASNLIFAVYLTRTPSGGIPASQGTVATVSDANLQR